MSEKYKYHYWLHFIVLIWGFTGVLGRLLTDSGLDSFQVVVYRMLIGWISLLLFLIIIKHPIRIDKKGLATTIGVGVIISAHWYTFFKSIELSNVSFALIFMSTTALFTSLIEPIIIKKKFDYRELLMGIVVTAGIIIIVDANIKYFEAALYGLASAFLAATFSVFNSKLVKKYDSKNITLYEIFGGSIILLIIAGFSGKLTVDEISITLEQFTYLAILGIVCTSFAFVVTVYIMKFISAYTINMTVNLEPIYAMIFALLIFKEGEIMTWRFYVGATIVLGTILLNAYIKGRSLKGTNTTPQHPT